MDFVSSDSTLQLHSTAPMNALITHVAAADGEPLHTHKLANTLSAPASYFLDSSTKHPERLHKQ